MAINDNTSYELTGAQVKDLANKIKAKAADNIFVGATSSAPGSKGLVPQPQAGDNTKFLSGDGTWKTAGGSSETLYYVVDQNLEYQYENSLFNAYSIPFPNMGNVHFEVYDSASNQVSADELATAAENGPLRFIVVSDPYQTSVSSSFLESTEYKVDSNSGNFLISFTVHPTLRSNDAASPFCNYGVSAKVTFAGRGSSSTTFYFAGKEALTPFTIEIDAMHFDIETTDTYWIDYSYLYFNYDDINNRQSSYEDMYQPAMAIAAAVEMGAPLAVRTVPEQSSSFDKVYGAYHCNSTFDTQNYTLTDITFKIQNGTNEATFSIVSGQSGYEITADVQTI